MSRTSIAAVALIVFAPVAALTAAAPAQAAPTSDATDAPHARKAPARFKVTARINTDLVIAGEDKVKVKGRVKPRRLLKGKRGKIVLQQRVEGKKRWTKTDKAKVKRNGKYVLKDKPSRAGEREYRVVMPGKKGVKRGVSKKMEVTVYAWELLSHQHGAKDQVQVSGGTIATKWYPALVTETPGTAGFIEYTLGNKCLDLRATYALLDTSATGSSGTVKVSTDGNTRSSYNLAVGTIAADEQISVRDVFRLRFDLTSTADPAAYAAVAGAQVLCR